MNKKYVWAAVALLAAAVILTGARASRRAAKGSSDFDTFHAAGKAVTGQGGLYYTGEFYQSSETVSPFLYPPAAAFLFAPFAAFPLKAGAFLWNAALWLSFIWLILLFAKWTRMPTTSLIPRAGPQILREPRKILWVVLALVFLFDNLGMAQVNVLVLALSLAAALKDEWGKSLSAGALCAAAFWLKLIPGILLLYWLVKRRFKTLAAFAAASLVIAVLLPLLAWGPDTTRIHYQQWIGRTIKPRMIGIFEKFRPYEPHPRKKSPKVLRNIELQDRLTEKNQSLEAALTRLFLKDRHLLADDTEFPVSSVRRYPKLPVLGGGLEEKLLTTAVRGVNAALLLFFLWLLALPRREEFRTSRFELALVFLCMSLFAPLSRSYQLITFLPAYVLFAVIPEARRGSFAKAVWISVPLYICQLVPYGNAAGAGAWANLVLALGVAAALFILKKNPAQLASS